MLATKIHTAEILKSIEDLEYNFNDRLFVSDEVKGDYNLQINEDAWLDFEYEVVSKYEDWVSPCGKPMANVLKSEVYINNLILWNEGDEVEIEDKNLIEKTLKSKILENFYL